jgi:molybdopterin converting factor small subunit
MCCLPEKSTCTGKDRENEKENDGTLREKLADEFNNLSESFNAWMIPNKKVNMEDNEDINNGSKSALSYATILTEAASAAETYPRHYRFANSRY